MPSYAANRPSSTIPQSGPAKPGGTLGPSGSATSCTSGNSSRLSQKHAATDRALGFRMAWKRSLGQLQLIPSRTRLCIQFGGRKSGPVPCQAAFGV